MNASRKSNYVPNKGSAEIARDIATTSSQIQSLKIPDAVAALAQAAAKANDLPGWPLFSPPKVQLEKCTRCSREFCSSINFRRHTRVHRRTPKIDKDFSNNRDHLAAFWNKLEVDDASTILSLSDVVVEGVTGSSILTALSSWMCKPGYTSLPVAYARAGSELLDLIQTKVSVQLPVSSNELFSVLDEASEKTFLCTNTAACIQKFLFDGEAEKIATEFKNVVACASYMLEQKLVEAWSADRAAEALRCQKLLVEEEEAAQKRQAELMERKRMKKLRQKEQRLKDLKDEDVTVQSSEILDDATCSSSIQSIKAISDPNLYDQEEPQYLQCPPVTSETDNGFNVDLSVENVSSNLGPETDKGVVLRQQVVSWRHFGRTEKLAENYIVSGSMCTSRHPVLVRPPNYRDPGVCSVPNRNKTWAQKLRSEIEEQCPKHELEVDDEHDMAPSKNSSVLIGSISVAIEDNNEHSQDFSSKNHPVPPSSKAVKHASVKVMQVTHEENRNECNPHSNGYSMTTAENHSCSSVRTDEVSFSASCSADLVVGEHLRCTMFSSKEATAFLSQRWKEATARDHVKLVLCPEK